MRVLLVLAVLWFSRLGVVRDGFEQTNVVAKVLCWVVLILQQRPLEQRQWEKRFCASAMTVLTRDHSFYVELCQESLVCPVGRVFLYVLLFSGIDC